MIRAKTCVATPGEANLLDLPSEIIVMIIKRLDIVQIGRMIRVCKLIKDIIEVNISAFYSPLIPVLFKKENMPMASIKFLLKLVSYLTITRERVLIVPNERIMRLVGRCAINAKNRFVIYNNILYHTKKNKIEELDISRADPRTSLGTFRLVPSLIKKYYVGKNNDVLFRRLFEFPSGSTIIIDKRYVNFGKFIANRPDLRVVHVALGEDMPYLPSNKYHNYVIHNPRRRKAHEGTIYNINELLKRQKISDSRPKFARQILKK